MSKVKVSQLDTLREALDAETRKLFSEETTVAKVNAGSGALGKIIGSLNTQMAYAKARGEVPNVPYLTQK